MLPWILASLALYLFSTYVPAMLFLPREGLMRHLGARDDLPEADLLTGRARRAHANLMENMPIFITLALLAMIVEGTDMARAVLGAQLFLIGRFAYIPAYLGGVPFIRSIAYGVGLFGCGLMAIALL